MRDAINKMFDLAESFSANYPDGLIWLFKLRADPEPGLAAWMFSLNGYVNGLFVAGVINSQQLQQFSDLKSAAGY